MDVKSQSYIDCEGVLSYFQNNKVCMFGDFEFNRHIIKFLRLNHIRIAGYIVNEYFDKVLLQSHYDYKYDFPVNSIDEIHSLSNFSIAVHTENYDQDLLEIIKGKGVNEIFFIDSSVYHRCFRSFQARNRNSFVLEIDVAEHCNLACNSCYHFSQVAEPKFLDVCKFKSDMERMAYLTDGVIHKLYLMGGEPLLHPKLGEIIKITRKNFPHAFIQIITNGILLPSAESTPYGNLYEICADFNVSISMTKYPIKVNTNRIMSISKRYNVLFFYNKMNYEDRIEAQDGEMPMQKPIFDLSKSQNPSLSALMCYYAGNCFTLKDGKLSTCPIILNIHHFNKAFNQNLTVNDGDYIDIYKVNTYFELADFVAQPVSFCGYCDFRNRPWSDWKPSSKSIDEYL